MGIETEIKAELPDYASYLKIYSALGIPQHYLTQENFYIDTFDRKLQSLKVMFRLRVENGKNIFTVKSGGTYENGVQKSNEKEKAVAQVNWSPEYLREILLSLCDVDLPSDIEVVKQGSILNNRVVFSSFFGVNLELDHMQIFDKHYFEIEVETETPEIHIEKVKELLEKNKIPYKPSVSKYSRFLNLLSLNKKI